MMKLLFPIAMLSISIFLSSCNTDEEKINNCFERYKSDLIKGNGEDIANVVDSVSFSYYANLLPKVISFDSMNLIKMESFPDKIAILKIRSKILKQSILKMNSRQLLISSVVYGLTNNGSIEDDRLGQIKIDGDSATGEIISKGKRTPFIYRFSRINSEWKVRMRTYNISFRQIVRDNSINEEQYILGVLSKFFGKSPRPDIWSPLL